MYENYSVLFVDDEPHILSSLRRGLMDEEFTCYYAESGKAALELMGKNPVHVIVTDMRMPEMTGLILLKHVSERWPNTVKIVLSGYTQLQQILTTINQVDIFKFITKPWELEYFIQIVYKALDYYILREANESNREILEAQNLAYVNILRKIDDVVLNAKKSVELLCMIGKAIYGFDKKLDITQRVRYESIYSIQDSVFDAFCKAVVNEKKEYTYSGISKRSSVFISKNFPNANIGIEDISNAKVTLNIELIKAALQTIKLVFEEEFEHSAQTIKIGLKDESRIYMSILFRKPPSQGEANTSKEPDLFDVKLDFINNVIGLAMSMELIEYVSKQVDQNIGILFSVMENTCK